MPVYTLENPKHEKDDAIMVVCDCSSTEHILSIMYIDEFSVDGLWMYSIDMLLNPFYGFWKRVWLGVRYIFGYRSRYGHFDEILISGSDASEIVAFFNKHRKAT